MKNILKLGCYILILIGLSSCATRAKFDARMSCQAMALAKYPYQIQETIQIITKMVAVPTGKTTCTTRYVSNTAQTECVQETKLEPRPQQVSSSTDINSNLRFEERERCAIDICMKSHGNRHCE